MTEQGQNEAKGTSWAIDPPPEQPKKELTATEIQIAMFSQLRDLNGRMDKVLALIEQIANRSVQTTTNNSVSVPKLSPMEKVKQTVAEKDKDNVLADKLVFTEEGDYIIVKTKGFISNGFAILGSAMNALKAEYNNADKKNTFWKITKAKIA